MQMQNLSRATNRATYTVAEAAGILGISRTTAYECIQRGEIPARRFGRRVVVLRYELDRLLTDPATDDGQRGADPLLQDAGGDHVGGIASD
jgi:excisionase family DNA binding protein